MEIHTLAQILWDFHKLIKQPSKVDVIIGLNSYDIQTAVHCAELYYKKVADKIIFSGTPQKIKNGILVKNEINLFALKAIELGVPEDSIIIEQFSNNIADNIDFSLNILPDISSAVIVTKPNALRIAHTIAIGRSNLNWFTSCIDRGLFEPITFQHTFEDLLNEMVSDTKKLIENSFSGVEKTQNLPQKVLKAINRLRELGFDKDC